MNKNFPTGIFYSVGFFYRFPELKNDLEIFWARRLPTGRIEKIFTRNIPRPACIFLIFWRQKMIFCYLYPTPTG